MGRRCTAANVFRRRRLGNLRGMRKPFLLLVASGSLLLCSGATAVAQQGSVPPGNAGLDQYLETVPTVGGAQRATPTVLHHQRARTPARRSVVVPKTTVPVRVTAPRSTPPSGGAPAVVTPRPAARRVVHHRHHAVAVPAPTPSPATTESRISLPGGTAGSALTHGVTSGADGGLGVGLPILLVGSLLAVVAIQLLRRRRTTSS